MPSKARHQDVAGGPALAPAEMETEAEPATRGKKVLIVDDDQIISKLLSLKLKSQGYTVAMAADGSEAIRAMREEKPDAILMDINFPPDVANGGGVPWNGFRLLSWIRGMAHTRNMPVFFITESDPAMYKDEVLASGAMGVFHKPVDHDRLLKIMGEALKDKDPGLRPEAAEI